MHQLKIISFLCLFLYSALAFTQTENHSSDSIIGQQLLQKADAVFLQNLDSFLIYYQEAQPYFERIGAWEQYIQCTNGFSQYYYQIGDYDQFKKTSLEAIALTEKHLGKKNAYYSQVLNNYGIFLRQIGYYEQAQDYYQRSLAVDFEIEADNNSIAISYSNLGSNFRRMGDYQQAINYYDKAIQLQLESYGLQHFETARSILFKGHCFRDMKQLKKAKESYHTFLNIVKQKDMPTGSVVTKSIVYCYQSLAKIFLQENNADSTNYFIDQVIQLDQGEYSSRRMQSYEVLGDLHRQTANYEKALDAYQEAHHIGLGKYRKYEKHYSKAHNLKQVGEVYFLLNQQDRAIEAYQQALIFLAFDFSDSSTYVNPPVHNLISIRKGMEIIANKGQAYYAKYQKTKELKHLQAAFDNYEYATQLIQKLRQSFLAQGSKELLAQKALPIYEGGIKTALDLNTVTGKAHYLDKAFAFAEQNKAILLLESLQEADAKFSGGIPEEKLEKEKQLRLDIAVYEKQINKIKQKKGDQDIDKIKTWENKLFELKQQYQKIIAHFEKDYPQYYDIKYNTQVADAHSLRKKIIDPGSALLEYFIGAKNSYLFCITNKELKIIPLELPDNLDQSITELRQLITQAPVPESFLADCQKFSRSSWQLSQQLIRPALDFIPKEIKRLIIVPDDFLAYLPFELLLEKAPAAEPTDFYDHTFAYLQNQYAISYNYSASLLLNHSKNKNATSSKSFIGFAPSFGKEMAGTTRACDGDQLLSLNCNQQEVNNINALFNGRTLLASQANRQTFIAEASDYRIVHLATHACVGEDNLAQNKIHFTDDFLSNKDLHNLNLQADLAVLSACNTGSGKLIKGEGVMSLSRGFILAGCPSTLMSLWSVDDCTTSDLMFAFYKNIKDGLPKDQALQQAKIQHLKTADKATAHPYYWAAFVQSGNAEAMDFPAGFLGGNWRWILLGLGLLLFTFRKFST